MAAVNFAFMKGMLPLMPILMKSLARLSLVAALLILLSACTGIPKGIEPVRDLDAERYLGTWYSIVRLDHSFERRLTDVSAEYSLREDGRIRVVNRGYHPGKQEWREAEGVASFIEDDSVGRLRVSFFGPFYGGYNIIGLDTENYEYAMVSGPTRGYFWILARQPALSEETLDRLIAQAKVLGFAVDDLIFVEHGLAP